ncbi:HD domain-containing protein [Spirochaeta cellobiosiphila]|uniref:HD domain-containing protein n=1 Tax=Spirochaeta cellobiosiphila TaxID=504483 RepID=UPI0004095AD1|nr:HD domain-containing protein [Spirochaeta cellobiosiphila]
MGNLFFSNPIEEETLKKRKNEREKDRHDLRGYYFRDTTAIIHSNPFRRLKHKTQVFFAPKNDHICTRIEHVMHVATVAATICRSLDLESDLAWAIGVGHDLGHTPFGHVGETILGELMSGQGGFRHEIYSLRVVDKLIHKGQGLNLTYAVRDGIINHCGEKFEKTLKPDFTIKDLSAITKRDQIPSTWEGVVVRMSDKIAYLGRDLEDGIGLGLVNSEDIPKEAAKVLGSKNSTIIDTLANDLISYSLKEGEIGFSQEKYDAFLEMKDFNYQNIYKNPVLSDYHRYFRRILNSLHQYLQEIWQHYGTDIEGYSQENNAYAGRFAHYVDKMQNFYREDDKSWDMLLPDFIAGMTDDFALDAIKEIMLPEKFNTQFNRY